MADRSTDPRKIPGSMAGPGGPHDRGGVVLDTRNAVLLDSIDVSTLDPDRGARGQSGLALVLGGRINQTKDRASVLFIFGTDGAAGIITATGPTPRIQILSYNRAEGRFEEWP